MKYTFWITGKMFGVWAKYVLLPTSPSKMVYKWGTNRMWLWGIKYGCGSYVLLSLRVLGQINMSTWHIGICPAKILIREGEARSLRTCHHAMICRFYVTKSNFTYYCVLYRVGFAQRKCSQWPNKRCTLPLSCPCPCLFHARLCQKSA